MIREFVIRGAGLAQRHLGRASRFGEAFDFLP